MSNCADRLFGLYAWPARASAWVLFVGRSRLGGIDGRRAGDSPIGGRRRPSRAGLGAEGCMVTIRVHGCAPLSRSCSSAALHLHWRAALNRTPINATHDTISGIRTSPASAPQRTRRGQQHGHSTGHRSSPRRSPHRCSVILQWAAPRHGHGEGAGWRVTGTHRAPQRGGPLSFLAPTCRFDYPATQRTLSCAQLRPHRTPLGRRLGA